MKWKPRDVNNELQMFGALEFGNILVAAGLVVEHCESVVTQWPPGAEAVFEKLGEEKFIEKCKEYGREHDQLVTTVCVGQKPVE